MDISTIFTNVRLERYFVRLLGRFFPAWNRAKEIRLDGGNKQLPGSFSPGVKKVTLAKHG